MVNMLTRYIKNSSTFTMAPQFKQLRTFDAHILYT